MVICAVCSCQQTEHGMTYTPMPDGVHSSALNHIRGSDLASGVSRRTSQWDVADLTSGLMGSK